MFEQPCVMLFKWVTGCTGGREKSKLARRTVNRLQWSLTRLDAMALRLMGKSLGGRIADAPTLLLTTTGRRSGKARTTPLVYVRDGDGFLVVAAFGGSPWNPHWLANLRHEPRATVEVDDDRVEVVAAELIDGDRDQLWPAMLQAIKSLASAESRTDRTIPLIRLARARPIAEV